MMEITRCLNGTGSLRPSTYSRIAYIAIHLCLTVTAQAYMLLTWLFEIL